MKWFTTKRVFKPNRIERNVIETAIGDDDRDAISAGWIFIWMGPIVVSLLE